MWRRLSGTWLVFGLAVLLLSSGCRDVDVVTASYATLAEAEAAGAVREGWLPAGLPPGTYEIREAHDPRSPRRWGLFNFPPDEEHAMRGLIGAERPFAGLQANPPRRIEWWPVLLRRELDQERIAATGLRAYESRDGELIFAINWSQGRAYYWTRE